MKTFVINGLPRSGKDSFVDFVTIIAEQYNIIVKNISSVDQVKKAAVLLGWDEEKNDIGRKFLSDLKDLSTVNYNGPLNYMKSCLTDGHAVYFFMIREPAEIHKFIKEIPDTKTICVRGKGENKFTNHADQNVSEFDYDIYIDNTGNLNWLAKKANEFVLDYILKE